MDGKPDLSMFGVLELAVLRKALRDFALRHGDSDSDRAWREEVDAEIKKRSTAHADAKSSS